MMKRSLLHPLCVTSLTLFLAHPISYAANAQLEPQIPATKMAASQQIKAPNKASFIKTMLDNGLKVIIKKEEKPKVAVGMVWYKVGSADEPGGITGISHALEHMMFKGTPSYPPNAYSKIIAAHGGQENAFTTKDYTAYFAKITSNNLPIFLQLEADRMRHLTLDKEEFAKEIKVVQEERRMRTDDSPQGVLYERFMALAHLAAPYHHPVIGWMNDLEHMQIEDLKHWYQRWYAPNNATLVIVGDVEPQQTLIEIKKWFSHLTPSVLPTRKPQKEPPALGPKQMELSPQIKTHVPMVMIGFSVPSLVTTNAPWKAYALEVIASILSGGNSARLPKEVVRNKHSAAQASADYDLYARYDTQFYLFGVANHASPLKDLENDLLDEITRLQNSLVSPKELKRVKNQVIASKVYEKDSTFGQAYELGLLETLGIGYQASEAFVKQIEAITPKQIQLVAKEYFGKNRMTISRLNPTTHASKED